jgi:hypothetical protein
MFKRRGGLGGLRIVRGPVLREDPATGAGAGGAANGGGGVPPAPAPAPAPAAPPAPVVPPVVDVTQTKEFKDALAKAAADADAKARLGTQDKARTAVLDEIATALGLKPKDIDPAQIGKELADTRAENARLQQQIAVGAAARKAGGDEDMVNAWLSHKGLLSALDPTAANFASEIERIVTEQIKQNPKLAATPAAAPPIVPGASGPGAGGMAGGSGEGGRVLGLGSALAAAQRR